MMVLLLILFFFLLLAYVSAFPQEDGTSYPNLPLGDINVVILTDTHSWLGGHGRKENYDINYGDVLSFYRILQDQLHALEVSDPDKHKRDLFFVMNGDWIDGTGLAMNGDPSYILPLLERMPWDAVNVGNHELYKRSVLEYILRPGGFVEWWGPRYLSSNIVKAADKEPIGNRFHLLKGRHSTVLVFGFLYNMHDNDPIVTVERVQDVVNADWFEEVLGSETYDAVLVLAHMDHKDPLVHVILERIRDLVDKDMPVQFVTGHTHYRGSSVPDNYSSSFEAGRYLDTVGFVSFPSQKNIRAAVAAKHQAASGNFLAGAMKDPAPSATQVDYKKAFQHVFIDAKHSALQDILGMDEVVTPDGTALSEYISQVQEDLGLFEIVGCVDENYYMHKGLGEANSLWELFCTGVIPHVFPLRTDMAAHNGNPVVTFMDKGLWRYNLLAGELSFDEVIAITPFNDTLYTFPGIPGSVIAKLNASLHSDYNVMCPSTVSNLPQPSEPHGTNVLYDLVTTEFSLHHVRHVLETVWPSNASSTTNVPDAVLIANHTSTSIWLEFLNETDMCTTNNKNKGKQKTTAKTDSGHHSSYGTSTTTSFIRDELNGELEAWDRTGITFVLLAVVLIFVHTVVNLRRRSRTIVPNTGEREYILAKDKYSKRNEETLIA